MGGVGSRGPMRRADNALFGSNFSRYRCLGISRCSHMQHIRSEVGQRPTRKEMDTALLAELQSKRAGKRKSKPRGPPREAVAAQQLLAAKRAAARSDAASAKKGAHRVFVEALCALEAECGKGPAGKAKLASGLSMLLLYADTLITAAAANDAHAGRTIKVDASFHMRLGRLAASQQCLEALGFTLSTKRGGKQAYTAGHSIASIRCLRAMTTSKELLVLFSEGPSSRPSLDQRLRGLEAAAAKKAGGGGASGTLHVGGIQGDIEDETKLTELFSQFGAVETVTLRRRRGVKQGKQVVSWALVTFCAAESVARALEAHASLGSSHNLVVRTVDADQASGSTGAMSKVMQQHKSKFTALAQQRRQQRESAIDAQKPAPPAAAPAATAKVPAARKEGMSLAELARQRKLEKQRQNSAAPASATASASASAPVPKKAKGNERTLHVGGIQGDIEDETKLTELFSQFGAVETVTLRRRRGVKQGKQVVSWALVTFYAAESVAQATGAQSMLQDAHALVVRAVDQKQAGESTGAMGSIIHLHANKFLELAKQRKKQRLEKDLQTMMFGGGGGTATAGSGNEVKKQAPGTRPPLLPSAAAATIVRPPPPPPPPLQLGHLLAVGRDTERDGGGGGGGAAHGSDFSSGRTPTKARSAPLSPTSPLISAQLSPASAAQLNIHGSPRRSNANAGQPDSSSTSRVLLGLGGLVSDGNGDTESGGSSSMFAPSGVAPGGMVKVTEVKALTALDQQLQAALEVVQLHRDKPAVQTAAFTAIWNLTARSKKTTAAAASAAGAQLLGGQLPSAGNIASGGSATDGINLMIMQEALHTVDQHTRQTAAADGVALLLLLHLQAAALGALWSVLHRGESSAALGMEMRGVQQASASAAAAAARSNRAEQIVTAAMAAAAAAAARSGRGTATCSGAGEGDEGARRVVEFGECVLECL